MPQPAPAVVTIPAGYAPVAADFTAWVTNPFSFLAQPPLLRAQLTTAESLSGGFLTLMQYNSVLEDPYSGWSATATANQPAWSWLCPAGCGGWYDISLNAFTGNQATTTGECACVVGLNGSLWQYGSGDWAVSGGDSGSSGAVQVPLIPGDYLQFYTFVTATVSTPATAGQNPSVELAWVSS